jgi:hypothetical protein
MKKLELTGNQIDMMQVRGDIDGLADALRRKVEEEDRAMAMIHLALVSLHDMQFHPGVAGAVNTLRQV